MTKSPQVDLSALERFITQKWKSNACQVCGARDWGFADSVYELRPWGVEKGGGMIPLTAVGCMNCGNTIMINALVAGVVDPEDVGVKK